MKAQPQYVPIYFAPDADPSWLANPGVLTDVRNMVPTVRGTLVNCCSTADENLKGITPLVTANVPRSAKIMKRIGVGVGSGGARFFIGSDDTLYEVNRTSGLIVDVSKSVAAYSANEWAFDAFGDTMLAAARNAFAAPSQPIQASTGAVATAFADLASAPRASIVVVQRGFVVAYDCNDGVNWYNDGWMCSGQNNATSWCATMSGSANLATQANYGRVYETSGGWRAAHRMRDGIAAYKADSIYLGSYTGPITASSPNTWSHRLVSDRVGVANHNAVAIVNGVHYFIHRTGVYRFDGSYPTNIGLGRINSWLAGKIARSSLYDSPGARATVDEARGLIFWYVATSAAAGSLSINGALVYNVVADSFGWIDKPWNDITTADPSLCAPVQATASDLRSWLSSTDGRQNGMLTVGSLGGSIYIRGVNIGEQSRSTNTDCSLATGDIGDDISYSRVDQIKARLLAGDDDAIDARCTVDIKASEGDYFEQSGLQIQAVATGTGSGGYRIGMTPPGIVARVIQAGDYLAFDALMLQGNVGTPLGVRLAFTDTTTVDVPATITTLGKWGAALVSLAAHVGKTFSTMSFYLGAPAATGTHQGLIRLVRITDSTGVNRQRLFDTTDRIYVPSLALVTNYTIPYPYLEDVASIGRAFKYDARRRRWQGDVTGRIARARLTFNNKCEIGGLFINSAPQGPE